MPAFFENLRSSLGIGDSPKNEREDLVLEYGKEEDSENDEYDQEIEEKPKPAPKEQKKKPQKKVKEKQTIQNEIEDSENIIQRETRKISVVEKESEEEPALSAGRSSSRSWFEKEGELAVDVYQTENEIVVQTAIAGVHAVDLDVAVENDVVTIQGMRKNPSAEQKQYLYQECFWGPFSRQIILPEEVDASHSEATMKDGVFTLRMPKMERVKMKKIQVRG